VFSVTVFTALLGNVFQQWMFPSASAFTSLQAGGDLTPNSYFSVISLLSHDDSWSTLCIPDVNHTENTASNTSSVAAIA
jgi:hypothetical protein